VSARKIPIAECQFSYVHTLFILLLQAARVKRACRKLYSLILSNARDEYSDITRLELVGRMQRYANKGRHYPESET
jgi:hypothetical protein